MTVTEELRTLERLAAAEGDIEHASAYRRWAEEVERLHRALEAEVEQVCWRAGELAAEEVSAKDPVAYARAFVATLKHLMSNKEADTDGRD